MPTLPDRARLAPVVAHRGASAHAPENTLAAIARAADDGATAIEIDVNVSADGIPYVHHDERLKRCTGHDGRLHEESSLVLDELFAGAGMDGFEEEPLARLETVIGLIAGRRLALNLEIKPPPGREVMTAQAICDVLSRCWPTDLVLIVSSFREAALRTVAARFPEVTRALLVGAIPPDWADALERSGSANLHCSAKHFDPALTSAVRAAGHRVYCFTVNDDRTAQTLLDAGVDGVITDYPGEMLAGLVVPGEGS